MLRINDTRIYHEFGKNYLLREFTSREAKVQDIRVSNIAQYYTLYRISNKNIMNIGEFIYIKSIIRHYF